MAETVISPPSLPQQTMPHRAPSAPPALTAPMTSFVGRVQELDQIAGLLAEPDVRLVTLTGPGGVGKTRLAYEVGRRRDLSRYPDQWFITLMGWTSPHDVIPAIAHTVGVRESGDRPIADVLATALRDRRGLLVLDNAEHVLAAAPALAELLTACPGLTMLVTSREPLRLSGEHEVRLGPLPAVDPALDTTPFTTLAAESTAVQLFAHRALAARADFTVTGENSLPIRRLCHLLDGLPLAIELAAARIAMLSPASLLARIEQRAQGPLPFLTDGPRDLPDRQRTLRNAITWSYELLTAPEQTAFHAISVFECSFSLDHAETLIDTALREIDFAIAPAPTPFSLLAALVQKSMVVSYPDTTPPRFNLLSTIRDFGRERLDEQPAAARLRRLHAEVVRDQTAIWDAALEGPEFAATLALFSSDLGNITTALEHAAGAGDHDVLLPLAGNLADFWSLRGLHGDGMHWLSLALARAPSDSSPARIRALIGAGNLGMMRCDYTAGVELFEAAVAAAEAGGNDRLTARALFELAEAHDAAGNTPLAESLNERAAVVAGDHDASLSVVIERGRGEFARRRGDYGGAREALEGGLARSQAIGYRWAEADIEMALAAVARDEGQLVRGRDHLLAAFAIFDAVDDPVGIANVGTALAWLAPQCGEPAAAIRLYAASSHLFASLGLREPRHKYPAHGTWLSDLRAALGRAADGEWHAGWGMTRAELSDEIRALAARFTARQALPENHNGLTERELEVLSLLASGLSNVAIAERLFLSPRTINAHLTRIYGKLAVTNRHGAIRYAIDHELATAPVASAPGPIK